MNEQELGDALLRGESSHVDIAEMTRRVLQRDRRRVWILGTVCFIAWMAVVMVPWAVILPMAAKLFDNPTDRVPTQPELMEIFHTGTVIAFLSSIGSMFLASLCTVSLIIVSRRATLRQVNASLAEISAQLRAIAKS